MAERTARTKSAHTHCCLGRYLRHKCHAFAGIRVTSVTLFFSVNQFVYVTTYVIYFMCCDAFVIGRFVFVMVMRRISRFLSRITVSPPL